MICITAFLVTKTPSVNLYSSLWNILKALSNITNTVSLLILFQDKLFLSDISASVQQRLLSYTEPSDYLHANIRRILKCFAKSEIQYLFWMFPFKKKETAWQHGVVGNFWGVKKKMFKKIIIILELCFLHRLSHQKITNLHAKYFTKKVHYWNLQRNTTLHSASLIFTPSKCIHSYNF